MKHKVREKLLEKRNNLSRNEVLGKSNKIKDRLFSLREFWDAKTVMFYVSKENEVYTHDMIRESLNSKTVCVPVTVLADKSLKIAKINSFDELRVSTFDVLEPKNIVDIEKDKLDMIIVPGIAFDEKCNRIGSGNGYYDKFLKDVKAKKIALGFDFQILEKIPVEDYDIPVDAIVTEEKVYLSKN